MNIRLLVSAILMTLLWGQGQSQFAFTDSAVRARIFRDLAVLASDSLQGRKSGTSGEKKASDYIVNQFRRAGLEPMGTDSGSFLQPLPDTLIFFESKNTHLVIGGRSFRYNTDFSITAFSGNGKASGRAYDLGYGLNLPGTRFDDYRNVDSLKDRIVVINLAVPPKLVRDDSIEYKLQPVNRVRQAFARGAAGVILWNWWSGIRTSVFDFRQTDTLPGIVLYGCSEILDYMRKYQGSTVEMQAGIKRKHAVYHNVIGWIDNHAEMTVIFGAHYDHLGMGRGNTIYCGADDNASGTATILEMARYFREDTVRLSNYVFIAFSGEEEGLIGSSYYCDHPTTDLSKVRFMFNFDMVGRLGYDGNRVTAIGTASSPSWDRIYSGVHTGAFKVKKTKGAPAFSDHDGFYRKGIPVAYLTTGIHPDYHSNRDVPSLINYNGMVEIVKYAEAFTRAAENSGDLHYQKISGWNTFQSYAGYASDLIDYLLSGGFPEE
jgi:aminopeptidase YwaD